MRTTDNKKLKAIEFSFAIHTCKICGYEACSLKDLEKNFRKDKSTKKGYQGKCRSCYNEYARNWNKNNPYHAEKFNNKPENKIYRKENKRKYDQKYRFRDRLQRHTKAYDHIMKVFDEKFRKFHKVKEIDLTLPFDKVIKSYVYFTGILYDLITHYLESKGLDFELYFYPYDSKDKAYHFYIKLN